MMCFLNAYLIYDSYEAERDGAKSKGGKEIFLSYDASNTARRSLLSAPRYARSQNLRTY